MNWKIGVVIGFVLALGLGAVLVVPRAAPAAPAPERIQEVPKAPASAAPKAAPATFDPAARAPEAPAAFPKQDGHGRIAVVKLGECFDEKRYNKIKDIRAEFEGMIKELDEQAKVYETDAKDKADKIKLFPAGSKGRQDAVKKFELARAQLQIHKAAAKEIALNGYAKFQSEAYQEILRVIALVGREGGYDMVLKLDEVKFEEDNQPADVSQQIAIKAILYADPALDITNRVVDRLNQEYKKP